MWGDSCARRTMEACVDSCSGVFTCIEQCFSQGNGLPSFGSGLFVSSGSSDGSLLTLPLWASLACSGALVCCSALFSGLTLGLMSLDKMELRYVDANYGFNRVSMSSSHTRSKRNLRLPRVRPPT